MARRQGAQKVRVTATLNQEMIKALDQITRQQGLSSRSQALEQALAHWLQEQRKRQVEQEMETYYRSLTSAEKREDREWTQFVARAAGRRWE